MSSQPIVRLMSISIAIAYLSPRFCQAAAATESSGLSLTHYLYYRAMIYIFYNKILLRLLVVLCGLGIGLATWKYVGLSAEKLPEQGSRDALAIVSFLIAGWLVMLIAEVVDQHYMRAFAAL